VRSRRFGIDDFALAAPSTSQLAPDVHPSRTPRVLLGLRVRLAAPRLDRRIAAGEDPHLERALSCRSTQLVSKRSRRQLAGGLERSWLSRRGPTAFSAAIPINGQAVQVARPALEQLAAALRSQDDVRAQGVALTRLLLTDMCSALYKPAYADQLHDVACEALSALDPHRWVHGLNAPSQIEHGSPSPW
jgi:hypothetical protein